jgi:hypothetical protein
LLSSELLSSLSAITQSSHSFTEIALSRRRVNLSLQIARNLITTVAQQPYLRRYLLLEHQQAWTFFDQSIMRVTSAIAAVALLFAPAALADAPSGDWSPSTDSEAETTTTVYVTSAYSTTITRTMTLSHMNETSTYTSTAKPTGWNTTSTVASITTTHKPYYSATQASPVIATHTGVASVQDINLAVAALAGAAAMVWGSL